MCSRKDFISLFLSRLKFVKSNTRKKFSWKITVIYDWCIKGLGNILFNSNSYQNSIQYCETIICASLKTERASEYRKNAFVNSSHDIINRILSQNHSRNICHSILSIPTTERLEVRFWFILFSLLTEGTVCLNSNLSLIFSICFQFASPQMSILMRNWDQPIQMITIDVH